MISHLSSRQSPLNSDGLLPVAPIPPEQRAHWLMSPQPQKWPVLRDSSGGLTHYWGANKITQHPLVITCQEIHYQESMRFWDCSKSPEINYSPHDPICMRLMLKIQAVFSPSVVAQSETAQNVLQPEMTPSLTFCCQVLPFHRLSKACTTAFFLNFKAYSGSTLIEALRFMQDYNLQ